MRFYVGISLFMTGVALSQNAVAQDTVLSRIERAFAPEMKTAGVTPVVKAITKLPAGKVELDTDALPDQGLTADGNCAPVDPELVRSLIRTIAASENFDADLAEAVAHAESRIGNNPGKSKAGALGIMQLMPGTAQDMGVQDRCDTEANIRGGIRYLKKMLDEFGDPLLMLAAYNAGPQRVYEASGIPLNSETVSYIAKVLNYWKFSGSVTPKGKKLASNHPPQEELNRDDENQWRDGHVIDFQ